jgi:hypothetical protein
MECLLFALGKAHFCGSQIDEPGRNNSDDSCNETEKERQDDRHEFILF